MKIRTHLICIGVLAVALLAMFGDVLLTADPQVISIYQTDLSRQFVHWRHFGFSQFKQGNLPLWNPYIFSGAPFLAGFQSGLLYPPNWLYLIMPLTYAINIGIILNMLLGGVFMYCWALFRGISAWGRLLSSLLFMFCGSHYMHAYAGHLPNLCALVWAPLIFLAIDGLFEQGKARWVLLGIGSISMQILAGHPQYVYYTGIGATIYVALHVFSRFRKARKNQYGSRTGLLLRCGGFVAIYFGAILITAAQFFPGLQAAGESVRGQSLNYEFCAMFSFPPENFITFLAPNLFGDTIGIPYWGRCNLWEMLVFISIAGLLLAICGCLWGDKRGRRFCLSMSIFCTVLALGVYTPVFDFLYHVMPGFDRFRGTSKFMFLTSMFLILLSGVGFDWLIGQAGKLSPKDVMSEERKRSRMHIMTLAVVMLVAGLLLFSAAGFVKFSGGAKERGSSWHAIMKKVSEFGEIYIKKEAYDYPPFIAKANSIAWRSLLFAACTSFSLSFVLFVILYLPRMVYLVGAIAVIEILVFANHFKASFDIENVMPRVKFTEFLSKNPGDYRLFWPSGDPNQGMLSGAAGIWGYDPGVLLRYGQFIAFTQRGDADRVSQHVDFRRYNRLYRMLRCRFLITKSKLKKGNLSPVWESDDMYVYELRDHLPRVLLVEQFQVLSDRDRILSEMTRSDFDPAKTVILEAAPDPLPQQEADESRPGEVKVLESSTDFLVVRAEMFRPAILVITDAYSSGWRVIRQAGSSQKEYQIMPANYILRGIPLAAGKHTIRIEYKPLAFRVGVWVSIVSLIGYFLLLVWCWTGERASRAKNRSEQI